MEDFKLPEPEPELETDVMVEYLVLSVSLWQVLPNSRCRGDLGSERGWFIACEREGEALSSEMKFRLMSLDCENFVLST